MVGKCANPECSAEFRYLREGRVFAIDMRLPGAADVVCESCGRPAHVRHFWLCGSCAQAMTITCTHAGEVRVVRKSALATAAIPIPCSANPRPLADESARSASGGGAE